MKKILWFLVAGMMLSSCGLIDDLIGDDEEDEESSMEEPGVWRKLRCLSRG